MARMPVTSEKSPPPPVEGAPVADRPDVDHASRPAFDAAVVDPSTAVSDLSRSLLVRALTPRWRCGVQFGLTPRLLAPEDVEDIAHRLGIPPADVVRRLAADPVLSVQSIA